MTNECEEENQSTSSNSSSSSKTYIIKLRLKIYKDQVARQKRAEEFKENNTQDKDNQLKFIHNKDVEFSSVNSVNDEMYWPVFKPIDDYLKINHKNYKIFAETTLGAFIKVTSVNNKKAEDLAKASINSKRIDMLIIDYYGNPALVVEYTMHRVKIDALELADIELIVIENNQEEIIE